MTIDDLCKLANEGRQIHSPGQPEHTVCTALLRLLPLAQEVLALAECGRLPDGDGVDGSTLLWAEDWARKMEFEPARYTQEELDTAAAEGLRIVSSLGVE
jgi:hypothetical protein